MTLLLDVALAATMLFAAAWAATRCLQSASSGVRRTIWRAAFVGVAALPLLRALQPTEAAAEFVTVAAMPSAVSAASHTIASVPWLAMIWATGCVVVLGRLTVGLSRARRWGRATFAGDRADFSTAVTVPMTWGVVRPQILLPADARTWSEEARDLVVRHETAHVASHDWAWQTMARVVTAALWFHPLAWLADLGLRREAERAADDAVLAAGADPIGYAEQLVQAARSMAGADSASAAVVGMIAPSTLERRVRHVLDPSAGRRPAGWLVRATVAVLAAGLSVSAAAMQDPPVYKVGDEGVSAPKVIKEERPQYTKDAKQNKIQGEVILEGVVTEDGELTDIRVVKPLDASLDQSAIDAAMQWRFEPGRKNGHPVRVRVNLEFRFELRDTPPSQRAAE